MSGKDIKSRHQRAGMLWKSPMTKAEGSKWQKRMFMAKDGFLLYYGANANPNAAHFDTKPKGVIPLGGCKVEPVERGPGKSKFGIKITHPDFVAGRSLVLAADKEEEREAWISTLNDSSRVTMENALLGDSMIEKLRSEGTEKEKEREDALQKLQEQAMALAEEREVKLKILAEQETVLAKATVLEKEAEERIKAKEAAVEAALAEVEKRKGELEAQAGEMQREIAQRSQSLQAASSEYEKVQALISQARSKAGIPAGGAEAASAGSSSSSAGGEAASAGSSAPAPAPAPGSAAATKAAAANSDMSSLTEDQRKQLAAASGMSVEQFAAVERRAKQLEEEKLRLEREKIALERSVADMASTQAKLQSNLDDAEAGRKALQEQMLNLNGEEADLMKERALRKALEKKLAQAEESLRRLDSSLRRSGFQLDVDISADVRTLMAFFEERAEEAKRDAMRIELMKKALKAKRKYLLSSAKAVTTEDGEPTFELTEAMEGGDGWDDDEEEEEEERAGAARSAGGKGSKEAAAGKGGWFFGGMKAAANAVSKGVSGGKPTTGTQPVPKPAAAPAPAVAVPAAAASSSTTTTTTASSSGGAAAAPAAKAPAPAPAPAPPAATTAHEAHEDEDDGWNSDADSGNSSAEEGTGRAGAGAGAGGGGVKPDTVIVTEDGITITYKDEQGVLPKNWAKQTDAEGDTWYYNNATGETSWIRPNPDGSIPPAE